MIRKRRSLSSSSKKAISPPRAKRVASRRTRSQEERVTSSSTATPSFLNLSQEDKRRLIETHAEYRVKNSLIAGRPSWKAKGIIIIIMTLLVIWWIGWGIAWQTHRAEQGESLWGIVTTSAHRLREESQEPSRQIKDEINSFEDERNRQQELARRLAEELQRAQQTASSTYFTTSTAATTSTKVR